jgi:3-phosphoshikimate 1-carboxyvinyltransferase
MMGSKIRCGKDLELIGPRRLQAPKTEMDCQGSGTTLRIFAALSALTDGKCVLTGDCTLQRRPISKLFEGLKQLGIEAKYTHGNDRFPVEIQGGGILGGVVRIPGDESSQYISGLLFACSKGSRSTRIELTSHLESRSYVEMTLDTMRQFGADAYPSNSWTYLNVPGKQEYVLSKFLVEGDYSSAAFLMAAGALTGGVVLTDLESDSIQGDARIVALLKAMGAPVKRDDGNLAIGSSVLKAIKVDASNIPDLVPILAVLATQAEGVTQIYNAGRLRKKESDRLSSTSQELRKLGAKIEETNDGLVITGPTVLHGAELNSHDDHRIAMAGVIAGLVSDRPTMVNNIECVRKSYPYFIRDLRAIGAYIEMDDEDNKAGE